MTLVVSFAAVTVATSFSATTVLADAAADVALAEAKAMLGDVPAELPLYPESARAASWQMMKSTDSLRQSV